MSKRRPSGGVFICLPERPGGQDLLHPHAF